jgi:O-methyltransferase
MSTSAPVRMLKAAVRPLRRLMGQFAITPYAEQARLRALRDHLFWKAGALLTGGFVKGDYLEFGVYRGESLALAYEAISQAFIDTTALNQWNNEEECAARVKLWEAMRFVAFDSFEGLPETVGDDTYTGAFTGGRFRCSEPHFRENLRRAGVPDAKVVTVPGFFDKTLNEETIVRHQLHAAAIVNVDCDLYASARPVLDFVTPLLVDGSVLIFDDWFHFRGRPDMGERRALDEWSRAHPEITLTEYYKSGPWSNSFIVNTRAIQP